MQKSGGLDEIKSAMNLNDFDAAIGHCLAYIRTDERWKHVKDIVHFSRDTLPTFDSISLTRFFSLHFSGMSDLYTALRVSPRKKRCPPELDDDTVVTPKKLRTA